MGFLSCDSNKLPVTELDLVRNNKPAGTEHCLSQLPNNAISADHLSVELEKTVTNGPNTQYHTAIYHTRVSVRWFIAIRIYNWQYIGISIRYSVVV